MPAGKLVVLEGIDGAGTTTHTRRLAEALRAGGRDVVLTREPSDGPVGTLIRSILRREVALPETAGGGAPGWATQALLFAADRLFHIEAEIAPALERGAVVVCDRYYHSSLVYQTAVADEARALQWVRALNARARPPDLTLLLTVSAEEAARRRRARGGAAEIFDDEALQKRLVDLYAQLPEMLPDENLNAVDTERPEEEAAEQILEIVAAAGI